MNRDTSRDASLNVLTCLMALALAPAASGCSAGASHGGAAAAGGMDGGAQSATGDVSSDGGPTRGCGQGTSCTAGSDLVAPSADQGFQIETPDNAIAVAPSQEAFLCFYKTLPISSTVNIGKLQSWMTPQSSHHFIAYKVGGGGLLGGSAQPDGTLQSCLFGGGTWLYATSVPGEIIEMKMPDGVGLPFDSGTQVMLNMHFINPASTPAHPQVKMNFMYAQNVQYQAAAMVSFNTQINVPPATAGGPGTQTVSGTCTAPAGANFFVMTSHTHKRATLTEVNYVTGGQTTNLVHTTDWEHPDVAVWNGPGFLTVQPGDSFTYSCSYANTGTAAVTVGETAASNEMCMAIAYYFPASLGRASCR
jgi:hypothetical protein